ncbi:MAG TPA: class E sortase, partial [Acidimicrobiales bacterium]|nr:class E sortase [Acidimicrobiales bacterium]
MSRPRPAPPRRLLRRSVFALVVANLGFQGFSVSMVEPVQPPLVLDRPEESVALPAPPEPPPPEPTPAPVPAVPVDAGVPVIGRLEIPALGLDAPLHQGIELRVIDHGPSHWPGTALPGQPGNVVVAGHRVTNTRPFRNIHTL